MPDLLSHPLFAAWIGIGAIALSLLLILLLAYLRFSLRRRTQAERSFLASWRPLLLSSLQSSVATVLPMVARHERIYFLKLWNQLIRSASSNEAAENLIAIAYSVGADRYSRRFLTRGKRVECLLATLTLGHLRDHASWDALVLQTMAADNATSIHAFQALVQIDAAAAAQQLTPLMLARNDWAIAHIAGILQPAHAAFMLPLLEAADEIRAAHLVRALRLIEALQLPLSHAAILKLLDKDNDTDIIIAALRIANDASLLPYIRPHLQHPDWRVRGQAAKVIGRIGEHPDVNRLIPLLADAEWWVRYRAAQSLVGIPFLSMTEIELLRNNLSDRFARDMLSQAIAERQTL
ncbi:MULTISPECIES: HEAT repeat domain-containing protein [Oxalobacteraceae]|uniref:HEAT repeat domain-containing protein n=1 Tax=Herminiimonas sp. Marseille-P9896 TaxID=2742211 RepID=UPI0020CA7F37|nr:MULTISPECIES: HEAT repeat domain-containing protein [Oxalobacteraceae]